MKVSSRSLIALFQAINPKVEFNPAAPTWWWVQAGLTQESGGTALHCTGCVLKGSRLQCQLLDLRNVLMADGMTLHCSRSSTSHTASALQCRIITTSLSFF